KVCHGLLKQGGLVLVTTDFHAEKIHIDPDFKIFNLSYMIFSSEEILKLVKEAESNGFELISSEMEKNWDTSEHPIDFLNHQMAFVFLGFKKK
ncbi:MAG: hypothetical protein H7177_08400, partial [Rhizobacter sp.]|nr:hypothetical protein [Bacteriovorax sp.]